MSDAIAQTISLELVLPPSPVVLANAVFVNSLAQAERDIANLKVVDADSAQQAATLQQRLTKAGSILEAARKTMKEPYLEAGRKIDELAKAPASRIEAAKNNLKRLLIDYDTEQRRVAAAAEAARQKELARLEEIARKEREAEAAKQKELARVAAFWLEVNAAPIVNVGGAALRVIGEGAAIKWIDPVKTPNATSWTTATPEVLKAIQAAMDAGKVVEAQPPNDDFDFTEAPEAVPAPKTETQKALETLKHTPAVVADRPAGIRMGVSLRIKSINVAELPEAFLIIKADEAKLRSTFCTGFKDGDAIPEVAGVVFEVERTPVSDGRPVF